MATQPRVMKVYSHPRSGTAFLEAMLNLNFYDNIDTGGTGGEAGHWADRITVPPGPHGGMFGDHKWWRKAVGECLYAYRDGRDVALSLWRTKMMQHPSWHDYTLDRFLREPLDWQFSPGRPCHKSCHTIIEHWQWHLTLWHDKPNVHYVRFEELVTDPNGVMAGVASFLGVQLKTCTIVTELVGHAPNEGRIGAWREHFSKDDTKLFSSIVPDDFWGLWNE